MVLLGGLFAFVAIIGAASLPLQEASMRSAQRLGAEAVFEKIRFSLEAASASAPGFSMEQEFVLEQNATVAWNGTAFFFQTAALNRTWSGTLSGEKTRTLEPGPHRVAVRRQARSDVLGSGSNGPTVALEVD